MTGSLFAERLLYEHTVQRENESVEVTSGHPWWQGDGDATTRDGDIMVSAEKRIYDVSESQAKSTVSSSVSISCNINGSFVGVAQIKGTADTGASAFLASSYESIADSGIPDTLSTSDLDKYQAKSGNKNKAAYTLRLPGVNSDLLYTGIERHGVLLEKGFDAFGWHLFGKDRDLNFGDSASTVKQKRVGVSDADIVAMFSPYASASGSAQNNAGQGIGNQVPSSSADTGMEGETKKHFSANAGGSGSGGSSSSSSRASPSGRLSGHTSALAGNSIAIGLSTTTAFSQVYWYVAAPGESGLGSYVDMDYGSSSSTTESFTYTFGSDATSGDYKITAYIYNYSDSSTYEVSHTVSVSGGSGSSSSDDSSSPSSSTPSSSPPSYTPPPYGSLSGPSTAASGNSVTLDLMTDTPFSSVYWYVSAPGDLNSGSSLETDTGGSSSTSASFTYTFDSWAFGYYTITAYIYNYSDNVAYEATHTVYVTPSGGSW